MPPDLALCFTFISLYYPYLEQIFMVSKVLEPWKFYCMLGSSSENALALQYILLKINYLSIINNKILPFPKTLLTVIVHEWTELKFSETFENNNVFLPFIT